ncbi:Ig-like domain-containing protein [Paenibacillus hexagrammi]|uniref:Ig-like domain-containing protein n=1 Tax=Paenibacillus hexagrammi TaxID=2908839 RepID=A0ABY3SG88_9BACL|nr:Ig-like domain-containing protein [Paenibacillus sp. YPD9-1]UJF32852.1 Ig-like domain-containing protein [Paenibacillus sp. YPD9-1]
MQAYSSGETIVTAQYGEKTATMTVQVDAAKTLQAKEEKYLLQPGDVKQVALTATFEDDTTEDVTDQAVWTVKDAQVATVQNGQITAVSRGATTVTASFGLKSVDITVSVGEITRIAMSEKKVALSDGGFKQLGLTVYFKDGTTKDVTSSASWSSSSSSIAAVYDGLVEAVDSGKATVTASYGDQSATTAVEVNIAQALTLNKRSLIVKNGDTSQLSLTMTNSSGDITDVTDKADWTVGSTKIAEVSTGGLVTAYDQGKTTVSAKYGGKTVSIPLEIDVATKLVLSKKSLQLKSTQTENLTATAYFSDGSSRDVTSETEWSSSKIAVADVEDGTLTAYSYGKATIKAKFGGKTVTLPVEVDKLKYLKASTTRVELTAGSAQQLTLTATYADGSEGDVSQAALWTSSNEKVADTKDGKITAVYKGLSRVTAKFAGKTVTIVVVVK